MCPSPLLYLTAYSRKKTQETTDWIVYLCFSEIFFKNSCFLFFFCKSELSIPIVNPVRQMISFIHSLTFAGLDGRDVGIGG